MGDDFGLLLDAIGHQWFARHERIAIAAERVAAQREIPAPAPLRLPLGSNYWDTAVYFDAAQRFPQPRLMRALVEAGIGLEVMDLGSACRTYNILVAEHRNVAAALLFDPA